VVESLRERKKAHMRQHLREVAIRLFIERGFDGVSVTEIAAAADVSKMTVLNYFPTKEDLVVSPLEDHVDEPARVVRGRAPGESAVAALRRQFLAALAGRDPVTGLNDVPRVRAMQQVMTSTPALVMRVLSFAARSEDALTEAFAEETGAAPGDLTPRLAAAQVMGVRLALMTENGRRIAAGESADAVYPAAVAAANLGFDLLERGLGDYARGAAPAVRR
jgi:AcrR family transcriptional regulator